MLLLLVALLVADVGVGRAAGAQGAPPAPRVTVTPSSGLRPGQRVLVAVSGFPGAKAYLSLCARVTDLNPRGCGPQLGAQPFVVLRHGRGARRLALPAGAARGPLQPATVACRGGCVLVATAGAPASGALTMAAAPLSFRS